MLDYSSLPTYQGLPDSLPLCGDRDGGPEWFENRVTVAIIASMILLLLGVLLLLGILLFCVLFHVPLFLFPQMA